MVWPQLPLLDNTDILIISIRPHNMTFPRIIFLAAMSAILGMAGLAYAEVTGPELYISSKGEARIVNATIDNWNAINLFSVTVWGLKWTVTVDRATRIEAADGTSMELSQILKDHSLEIKGGVIYNDINRRGWVEARLVRDLSVGVPPPAAPLPAAISAALMPAPTPASTPAPISLPANAPATASPEAAPLSASPAQRILTQQLRLGMRGGEVVILQEFLQKNNWGIPDDGPVTGYYGKVTVNAVKKLQAANGLPPEGEVGPKTRKLINEFLVKTQ